MDKSAYSLIRDKVKKAVTFSFIFIFGLLTILGTGNGDDKPGTLQFSSATYTVTEGNDLNATITVTRINGSTGAVSANYATADGTATQPADYTQTSGSLNWAEGDTANKTFDIPITDDSVVELTQAFTVTLTSSTPGTPISATVTILNDDLIPVTGIVFAPGGTLAFMKPNLLQRMYASIFGSNVNAAISDLVSTVAGATVSLYEVDASGNLVGAAKDSTTTNSTGDYTLNAPVDVLDSVKYIVRASGSTENMDSRITSTTPNINPSTDATSRMVAAITSDLARVTPKEVLEMQTDMDELVTNIDTAGADATQLSDNLFNEGNNQVGIYNTFRSKVSQGQICGNVQTVGGTPLEDILIVVRDFANFVARAKTYTDASGNYCVNAPAQGDPDPDTGGTFSGEYIIGAKNRTDDTNDATRSASEWYSAGGISYNQFEGDKVSVTSAAPITGINFALAPGARITGSITASGSGANLEGVKVIIRDYRSRTAMTSARADENGIYSINVIAGEYLVVARNKTKEPFASEAYDAASGTNNRNFGMPVTVSTAEERTVDFVLEAGSQLTGTITDGATSNLVAGARVKLDIAGDAPSMALRTNRQGYYHVWLQPDSYDVYAYGQRSLAVDLTSSASVNFAGTVSRINGVVEDASTAPLSIVKMWLYDATGTFLSHEISNSDGSYSLYTDQTGDHLLLAKIDRVTNAGGIIYQNDTRLLSGDPINIASQGVTVNAGTLTLPDGGVLTGHVYAEASGSGTLTPLTNFRVQVRDDNLPTAGTGNTLTDRFVQTRTRGDGSYVLTLPPGIYDRVKMRDTTWTGSGPGNCNNITITAGSATVLNFYDADNTCETL